MKTVTKTNSARVPAPSVAELRTRPTVSIEEAGAVLGLGRASAYAAAKRGDIPTIAIGRRRVVASAILLRLIGHES